MEMKKSTKKYYFTVEGNTEKWYLDWLQKIINSTEEAIYKVSIDSCVEKNPLQRAKSLTVISPVEIYHLSDYESDDEEHIKNFMNTMNNMKAAENIGKEITYKFGYSNFTFDLWIILHKQNCNSPKTNRFQYLDDINSAYGESFLSMKQYKSKENFEKCLASLKLSDIIDAVNRAKNIMRCNADNGYKLYEYKGYRYYKENPSLFVWEPIENILKDCGLYKA